MYKVVAFRHLTVIYLCCHQHNYYLFFTIYCAWLLIYFLDYCAGMVVQKWASGKCFVWHVFCEKWYRFS